MGFLKDAFERMPRPILEGRGIKVFRFEELTQNSSLKDFCVMESWGWEDVWEDMLDDVSVQTLVQDVTELMVKGVSLKQIEDNLGELEDKASTNLTTEERVVLLKWLEKHEKQLKGVMPEENEEGMSSKQIEKLRKEYGGIDKIDPESSTYTALIKHLDSVPQNLLKQLAGADIKFVSMLARNRVK